MNIKHLHNWDVCYADAVSLQYELAGRIVLEDERPAKLKKIAGADISYSKNDDLFFAAVVVLDAATMEVIEESSSIDRVSFPYIPGLLSFREAPVLLKAFEKIGSKPDIVMFDGQGIAHPRRMGLASHMGLFLDIPALGCAKKKLVGDFAEPGIKKGSWSELVHRGERIGAALRTKDKVKPVFISPGHRIGFSRAIETALACCRGYRIPEPTRQAHLLVNRLRLQNQGDTGP
ncbi:MAG: deoxyribonuclease V [Syntrophaceae bacterium]